MGLFSARPEEPTEWAGLPSEPLPPRSAAETLSDGPPPTDLGALGASISISIPVVPITDGANGDGAGGD